MEMGEGWRTDNQKTHKIMQRRRCMPICSEENGAVSTR